MALLPNLVVFKVGNNLLSGTIPSDWSASTKLQVFSLEFNRLTGTLPSPAAGNLLAPERTFCSIIQSNVQ